jgi:hypothetical protein
MLLTRQPKPPGWEHSIIEGETRKELGKEIEKWGRTDEKHKNGRRGEKRMTSRFNTSRQKIWRPMTKGKNAFRSKQLLELQPRAMCIFWEVLRSPGDPATMPPPILRGVRPVALRPIFSGGLPLSGFFSFLVFLIVIAHRQ